MADLLSVVVGGVLAVGGGAATQWYFDKRKREEEKRSRKSIKFEELIFAIYELDHWIRTVRDIRVFGKEADEPPSPYGKLYSIAAIHFPEFIERVEELNRIVWTCERWMFEKAQCRLKDDISGLTKGSLEVFAPYTKAHLSLIKDLVEFAKKGFN